MEAVINFVVSLIRKYIIPYVDQPKEIYKHAILVQTVPKSAESLVSESQLDIKRLETFLLNRGYVVTMIGHSDTQSTGSSENIELTFNEVSSLCEDKELCELFVYVSSFGTGPKDTRSWPGFWKGDVSECECMSTSDGISMTPGYLYELFNKFSSNSKILALIDSTHNGQCPDLTYNLIGDHINSVIEEIQNIPDIIPDVLMFSSCKDENQEFSKYDVKDKKFYGLLTNAFLNTMEHISADSGDLSVLTVLELMRYNLIAYPQKTMVSSSKEDIIRGFVSCGPDFIDFSQ